MFAKKAQEVPHADLIDLLLDADHPTRKLLLFQALQAGAIKKSEAEDVIAQVERLERAAGPRSAAMQTEARATQPQAAARAA